MRVASGLVGPALLAVPLFAVTNADDLVLLTVFFSNPRTRTCSIVTGQIVGIGVLTVASILAARLALQLPGSWLPLLGVAPIALGIRQFVASSDDEDKPLPPAVGWTTIATITIANGGDNLGVYIPVFANESALGIAVICAVFAVLTLAWCVLARQITRHPRWGKSVQGVANESAPYVLILVGLWIVAKHPAIQTWLGISS